LAIASLIATLIVAMVGVDIAWITLQAEREHHRKVEALQESTLRQLETTQAANVKANDATRHELERLRIASEKTASKTDSAADASVRKSGRLKRNPKP